MWKWKEKLADSLSWVLSDSSTNLHHPYDKPDSSEYDSLKLDENETSGSSGSYLSVGQYFEGESNSSCYLHDGMEDTREAEEWKTSATPSNGFSNPIEQYKGLQKSTPLPELSEKSSLLSDDLRQFVHASLPVLVKGCEWVLLYSTEKHGISLMTLLRRSADLPGPCLLVSGDRKGTVFGGLLNAPLQPTPKAKFQGTNQTFVFTTRYGAPRLFRPTGANRYYYMCTNDLLAFGGGGNFALKIDGDLLNGTSGPCETFGSMCLAHASEFSLKNVELWGFAHLSRYL